MLILTICPNFLEAIPSTEKQAELFPIMIFLIPQGYAANLVVFKDTITQSANVLRGFVHVEIQISKDQISLVTLFILSKTHLKRGIDLQMKFEALGMAQW